MNNNQMIVKFDFHGDSLDCVPQGDKLWVSVRRVCEILGLDNASQQTKIKSCSWAKSNVVIITTLDARGRNFEQLMIEVRKMPMWLATINEGKVKAEIRPKLIRFQDEAAEALANHFLKTNKQSGRNSLELQERRLCSKAYEKITRALKLQGKLTPIIEATMLISSAEALTGLTFNQYKPEMIELNMKTAGEMSIIILKRFGVKISSSQIGKLITKLGLRDPETMTDIANTRNNKTGMCVSIKHDVKTQEAVYLYISQHLDDYEKVDSKNSKAPRQLAMSV